MQSVCKSARRVVAFQKIKFISVNFSDHQGGCDGGETPYGSNEGQDKSSKEDKRPVACFTSPTDPTVTLYDSRKYGNCIPQDNVIPDFEVLHNVPSGVFRTTTGEILGAGAGKCCHYKNPEYFSFHHMSYYDMHYFLTICRQPCPNTGRKPL